MDNAKSRVVLRLKNVLHNISNDMTSPPGKQELDTQKSLDMDFVLKAQFQLNLNDDLILVFVEVT